MTTGAGATLARERGRTRTNVDKPGQSTAATNVEDVLRFQPLDGVYGSTYRENIVYLHVVDWPGEALKLPAISRKIVSSRRLTGGQVATRQTDQGIELTVPPADREDIDTVVLLELDGPG